MEQRRADAVRRELIRLCHAGLDSHTLREETIKHLRKVIPIDVSFFATADPATLLFTGAMQDEILGHVTQEFLENEFLQDDVNKFAWLARNTPPGGGLVQATRQDLKRSPRSREILAPLGLGDELRAALITGGVCWGFLCLHRDRSSPPFTIDEATFLARLTPHLAEGLRKALLIQGTVRRALPDEPGVLLLAEDLSLAASTPTAERWLAEVAAADGPRPQPALP